MHHREVPRFSRRLKLYATVTNLTDLPMASVSLITTSGYNTTRKCFPVIYPGEMASDMLRCEIESALPQKFAMTSQWMLTWFSEDYASRFCISSTEGGIFAGIYPCASLSEEEVREACVALRTATYGPIRLNYDDELQKLLDIARRSTDTFMQAPCRSELVSHKVGQSDDASHGGILEFSLTNFISLRIQGRNTSTIAHLCSLPSGASSIRG